MPHGSSSECTPADCLCMLCTLGRETDADQGDGGSGDEQEEQYATGACSVGNCNAPARKCIDTDKFYCIQHYYGVRLKQLNGRPMRGTLFQKVTIKCAFGDPNLLHPATASASLRTIGALRSKRAQRHLARGGVHPPTETRDLCSSCPPMTPFTYVKFDTFTRKQYCTEHFPK